MSAPEGERIARLEQRQDDFDERLVALDKRLREDHHRLRGAEAGVQALLDAHKEARRAEDRQYRRLALAIQWGGLAMAIAMMLLTAVQLYTTMHHH